ncbi:hypothetical protein INR49_027147 [Caranx melampygus]|nr:hypothetical protein INR49_027147 [Caranx melampygus]
MMATFYLPVAEKSLESSSRKSDVCEEFFTVCPTVVRHPASVACLRWLFAMIGSRHRVGSPIRDGNCTQLGAVQPRQEQFMDSMTNFVVEAAAHLPQPTATQVTAQTVFMPVLLYGLKEEPVADALLTAATCQQRWWHLEDLIHRLPKEKKTTASSAATCEASCGQIETKRRRTCSLNPPHAGSTPDCPRVRKSNHRQSDQKVTCVDLRVRASWGSERAADALLRTKPRSPLLYSSIVFKYVEPPQSLLSFPSSCSRLFDNGGKWVLKRQLDTAQSGVQLGPPWGCLLEGGTQTAVGLGREIKHLYSSSQSAPQPDATEEDLRQIVGEAGGADPTLE